MSLNIIVRGDNVYSADVLELWLHEFAEPTSAKIDDIKHFLKNKAWYVDPDDKNINGKVISPMEVIENPSKHRKRIKMIKKSNTDRPIIICNDNLIDGYHRLSKAFMSGYDEINTFVIESETLEPFLIGKPDDPLEKLCMNMMMKVYYYRFGSEPTSTCESAILLLADSIIEYTKNKPDEQ